ncbi:alcohol dehydrogenase GroES-like domain-containing protein [Xylaria sp. FL1042]|nr:alcohol dehydrogenase GroES-like domain-containing protein [Xylaria sp. FL1042]
MPTQPRKHRKGTNQNKSIHKTAIMSSSAQVNASVLHGAKDLRVEQRTLPAPLASEVQIAVSATGLCGSDLHYYSHFRNGNIQVVEPLTLGHESAGIITAVGSSVSGDLRPGDRVALEVGLPCESCEFCAKGRYNICKAMSFRSSAKSVPHAQGTLQTRINHPVRYCHKLPPSLSLELGALIEPLSVAMHARSRAGLAEGSTVLILGAGAVGLLVGAVAKVAGAKNIVIADILPERTQFAVENGFADAAFTVPMARPQSIEDKLAYAQDVAEKIRSVRVNGEEVGEVDVTFECTGVESCMHTAIYSTKPGGKVMIIGMGTPIQTIPISAASLKEVDLVGVFRYANTYPAAIELLSRKNERLPDISKLVTQRFTGLDNIPAAFDMAGRVKDEQGNLVLKVMVNTSEKASL